MYGISLHSHTTPPPKRKRNEMREDPSSKIFTQVPLAKQVPLAYTRDMPKKAKDKDELAFDQRVGARIFAYRKARGLSQTDLAKMLTPPVTRQQVTNIEAGLAGVSAYKANQIALLLDVPVHHIVG
jgi:ribosome-binding protein aMBF1 (putative translation factor)